MNELIVSELFSRLRQENSTMYGNHERTVPMFVFTEKAWHGGSADPLVVGRLLEQGLIIRAESGPGKYLYLLK
jgi:hypothetical protein